MAERETGTVKVRLRFSTFHSREKANGTLEMDGERVWVH